MSALSDALAQAQARAVSALAKQYVSGQMSRATVEVALAGIGLLDPTDTAYWLASLEAIRDGGAAAPGEARANGNGGGEATEAQLKLIGRLCDDKQRPAPTEPLTKDEASKLIEQLKAS